MIIHAVYYKIRHRLRAAQEEQRKAHGVVLAEDHVKPAIAPSALMPFDPTYAGRCVLDPRSSNARINFHDDNANSIRQPRCGISHAERPGSLTSALITITSRSDYNIEAAISHRFRTSRIRW